MKGLKLKKYIFFLVCLVFFTQAYYIKAHSYEAFDGDYSYNQHSAGKKVAVDTSKNDEEVLFIVDFSQSMSKHLGYSPKIYHAIDAIRYILNTTGSSTKIGLRVFGVTDLPLIERTASGITYNKKNICSASSLVLPIARYNKESISDKLSTLKPQGATPIGYSLRQAVQNDFSAGGNTLKHIILITDGSENCGDNPCLFIKRLMTLRDDIKIDVIGITVDDNAYSQLNCIAQAAKGEYYSVNSPEDFKIKFKQAFDSTPKITQKTVPVKVTTTPPAESGIKYKNYAFRFDY